jgi:hypothetical protein
MGPTAVIVSPQESRRSNDGWNMITSLVLDGISSPHTRRAYSQALAEFLIWFQDVPGRAFSKATVQNYRAELVIKGLAPSSINVRTGWHFAARSPEKAGVGGSIPSLATMFSITSRHPKQRVGPNWSQNLNPNSLGLVIPVLGSRIEFSESARIIFVFPLRLSQLSDNELERSSATVKDFDAFVFVSFV